MAVKDIKVPFEMCDECGRHAFPVDFISLPKAEYEALIAKASAVDVGTFKNYRKLSKTRMSRNREHAEFALERLPTMTVSEVLRAFVAKFGEGVISRSQLYRFAQDLGFAKKE
jgi:hypothetical protein